MRMRQASTMRNLVMKNLVTRNLVMGWSLAGAAGAVLLLAPGVAFAADLNDIVSFQCDSNPAGAAGRKQIPSFQMRLQVKGACNASGCPVGNLENPILGMRNDMTSFDPALYGLSASRVGAGLAVSDTLNATLTTNQEAYGL